KRHSASDGQLDALENVSPGSSGPPPTSLNLKPPFGVPVSRPTMTIPSLAASVRSPDPAAAVPETDLAPSLPGVVTVNWLSGLTFRLMVVPPAPSAFHVPARLAGGGGPVGCSSVGFVALGALAVVVPASPADGGERSARRCRDSRSLGSWLTTS